MILFSTCDQTSDKLESFWILTDTIIISFAPHHVDVTRYDGDVEVCRRKKLTR